MRCVPVIMHPQRSCLGCRKQANYQIVLDEKRRSMDFLCRRCALTFIKKIIIAIDTDEEPPYGSQTRIQPQES